MKLRLLILLLLGAFVMKMKYLVQAEDANFISLKAEINDLEQEVEILKVEYIYLTRPERILDYANRHSYNVNTSQIKSLHYYLGGV